jgi:hypothetical protein
VFTQGSPSGIIDVHKSIFDNNNTTSSSNRDAIVPLIGGDDECDEQQQHIPDILRSMCTIDDDNNIYSEFNMVCFFTSIFFTFYYDFSQSHIYRRLCHVWTIIFYQ